MNQLLHGNVFNLTRARAKEKVFIDISYNEDDFYIKVLIEYEKVYLY